MTDRELLPLADGLHWETLPTEYAIGGASVRLTNTNGDAVTDARVDPETMRLCLYEWFNLDPCSSMNHTAIIALLHRAGLLDELMCAVWSMAIARAVVQLRNHGSDGCASLVDELHAQNPYLPRKGES